MQLPPSRCLSGYSDPELRAVVTARTGKHYLIFDPTDTYTPIGLLGFSFAGQLRDSGGGE